MPNQKRKPITEKQWRAAVDSYEVGTKHGAQIARELGVSRSTVSRELKRRGCIKACRVSEYIAHFEAALDAEHRREALERRAEDAAAAIRLAEIDCLIGGMIKTILAADKAGKLSGAGPAIEKVRQALAA